MRTLLHKHRVCAVLFPRFLKVFARLCFVLLFSKLCYACFASRTSGLCSAIPSLQRTLLVYLRGVIHPFLRSSLNLSLFPFIFLFSSLRPSVFDPLSVKHNSISWVHHDGKALDPSPHSPQPYNAHLSSVWINSVICGDFAADVSMLAFPDPAHFLAGQLHQHLQAWIDLAGSISYPLSQTVLDWLENKVQVQRFFRHFKGNFKGKHFDSPSPPKRVFYIHFLWAFCRVYL